MNLCKCYIILKSKVIIRCHRSLVVSVLCCHQDVGGSIPKRIMGLFVQFFFKISLQIKGLHTVCTMQTLCKPQKVQTWCKLCANLPVRGNAQAGSQISYFWFHSWIADCAIGLNQCQAFSRIVRQECKLFLGCANSEQTKNRSVQT